MKTLRFVTILNILLAVSTASFGAPAPVARLVRDINTTPGPAGAAPSQFVNLDGRIFFVARGSLWRTDGTPEGTVLVKELPSLLSPSSGRRPRDLVNVDGTLFFSVFNAGTGRALWKSDGTTAGTVLVTDTHPSSGVLSPGPESLTAFGSVLLFTAGSCGGVTERRKGPSCSVTSIAARKPPTPLP